LLQHLEHERASTHVQLSQQHWASVGKQWGPSSAFRTHNPSLHRRPGPHVLSGSENLRWAKLLVLLYIDDWHPRWPSFNSASESAHREQQIHKMPTRIFIFYSKRLSFHRDTRQCKPAVSNQYTSFFASIG
jgi:hypothetical protein